ncbi:MAG: hypothetical protein KGL39_42305 [Patescibacteria group bacterium]|nr:hypothetical protein [Patescibacteria group bacterium]
MQGVPIVMPLPTHTAPLANNRGQITLADTTHEVSLHEAGDVLELRIRTGPVWTHIPMRLCGEVDGADFWHADTCALGPRWEFRIDPELRELRARWMPQPVFWNADGTRRT